MSKRRIRSIRFSSGECCPKCGRVMDRYRHPNNWEPKDHQILWYAYWDMCKPCKHLQHYERAKRFRHVHEAPPRRPVQEELDLQALHDLRERGLR